MPVRPIITLTTDFGCEDTFVGVMKGVILKINPDVEIVDLTHGIRPGDIREAAYKIGMNFGYFPDDTLHVVVVDPGVGSQRRPLLLLSNNHYFIGPDNGVFSCIYGMKHETLSVVHVTSEHYFLKKNSPTFHGRDVFAPVAAWMSRGVRMEKFGDPVTDYVKISLPAPLVDHEGGMQGEVIFIDRFGNAITNITKTDIDNLSDPGRTGACKVRFRGEELPLKSFYGEGERGVLCSLINSSALLEVFIREGNAGKERNISVGEHVVVNRPS